MFKKALITLAVLLLGSLVVFAQGVDDEGNVNDPTVNERANACYEGGSMEDRCLTEWDWAAGWYVIRVEFGIFERADVPAQYLTALPAPPPVEEEGEVEVVIAVPTTVCVSVGKGYFLQFDVSTMILNTGAPFYEDTSCTTVSNSAGTTGAVHVLATSQQAADTLCGQDTANFWINDVYYCSPHQQIP